MIEMVSKINRVKDDNFCDLIKGQGYFVSASAFNEIYYVNCVDTGCLVDMINLTDLYIAFGRKQVFKAVMKGGL